MIAKIKKFLFENDGKAESGGKHAQDELHIAAAALLLEAGMLDGSLDAPEKEAVKKLIQERFELDEESTQLIMTESEARAEGAVDIFGFLKVIIANFDHDEQLEMIEMLWDVVCADGRIDDLESNLVRRVTGMMGITDQESGAARKRALARAGMS